MDIASDLAFETRTSVFHLLSTRDEGLELAAELTNGSPLLGSRSPLTRQGSLMSISHSALDLGSRMAQKVTPRQQMAAGFLCLLLGLGALAGWMATGAGLLHFYLTMPIQQPFFIWMMTAYYGPMLLLLVVQRTCEGRKSTAWTSTYSFALRLALGAGGSTACMVALPGVTSQSIVLIVCAALGCTESLSLSSASQLFKLLPPQCYGYYFTGTSAAAVIIVALAWFCGIAQPGASLASLRIMYFGAGVMTLASTLAGMGLLASKLGRHYIQQGRLDMAMGDAAQYHDVASSAGVFMKTWSYHGAVLCTSCASVLVTALLPFFPSEDDTWKNTQWRLVLLFLVYVASVIGRQLRCTVGGGTMGVVGIKSLLVWVFLRTALGAALVLYTLQAVITPANSTMLLTDTGLVIAMVVFFVTGGVLLPPAYDLARNDLHPVHHAKLDFIFLVVGSLGIGLGLFLAFVTASAINSNTTSLIPFT